MSLRKIIFLSVGLLVISAMMFTFVSCAGDADGDVAATTTSTEENADMTPVFSDGVPHFSVVYSTSCNHSMLTSRLTSLCNAINVDPDWSVEPSSSVKEIIIGNTNRDINVKPEDVGANDAWSFVGFVDGNIVINASDDHLTNFALKYFVDTYLSQATEKEFLVPRELSEVHVYKNYYKSEWLMKELPAYLGSAGLKYSSAVYDAGNYFMTQGKGVEMQIAYNTNLTEYDAYIKTLTDCGYVLESQNTIESNKYSTLYNGITRTYVYYTKARTSTSVIVDNYSTPLSEFCYTTENVPDGMGAQFWLYGLNQDPLGWNPSDFPEKNKSGYINAGQFQIIKCADNSLIMIDGGSNGQCDYVKLDKFLHHITGKDINEKVTISAWYFTHADGDHIQGARAFITKYSAKYDVQRVMVNFYAKCNSANIAPTFREYYPNCMEVKIHTGQTIKISDVTIQVFFTHEDAVKNDTGVCTITDNNNSCSIIKVSTKDMSMMVLGDSNTKAESYIVQAFPGSSLKADIVQQAHHGWNPGLKAIYQKVNADIIFFTQTRGALEDPDGCAIYRAQTSGKTYNSHFNWLMENYSSGGAYYSGKYEDTTGLVFKNGKIEALGAPKL